MNIPSDLLTEYKRGRVLVFIGQGVNGDEWAQLAAVLAERLPEESLTDLSTPEVAQEYEDAYGSRSLIQAVRDFYGESDRIYRGHRLLASLTDTAIFVTVCLDDRLERAFAEAGRELNAIVSQVDRAYGGAVNVARLYKLHGTLSQPDTIKLTEQEIQALYYQEGGLPTVLKGHLADNTILFVGFALDDPFFQQLYLTSIAPLDRHARRAYALGGLYSRKVERFCKYNEITLISYDPADFLTSLIKALEDLKDLKEQPLSVPSAPITPGKRPYKKLFAYEPEDAGLFFGRRRETEQLLSLIQAHRLVILHGLSGTGKSSLLGAGITPYLTADGYRVIIAEAENKESPSALIRRQIATHLPQEATISDELPFLKYLAAASEIFNAPLVILLDQFEDFFIHLDPEMRAEFTVELAQTLAQRALAVKWVLSLRSEWFSALSEMRDEIRDVFKAEFRLEPLVASAAREAIEMPAQSVKMCVEPELVNRLLQDLGPEVVQLPQLQLVCDALYDAARKAGRNQLQLATYEAMGGAEGILANYLNDFLRRFPSAQAAQIRSLLHALVTSEGTVATLSATELAEETGIGQEQLGKLLRELEDEWLIRPVERVGQPFAYQLAHSYLADTLAVDPELLNRKAIRELLRQEVSNWHRFGTLISQEKLAFLRGHQVEIELPEKAQELIFRSALQSNGDIDYWVEKMSSAEICAMVLTEHLTPGQLANARPLAALSAIPHVANREQFKPLLTDLALDASIEPVIRQQAAVCLAQVSPATVVTDLRQRNDGQARQALTYVYQAHDAGIVRVTDRPTPAERARAIWFRLDANREYIVRTAIAAGFFGGGLGGLLAGLALFSFILVDRWIFILGAFFVPAQAGLLLMAGMSLAESILGNQRWLTRSLGGLLGGAFSGILAGLTEGDPTELVLGVTIGAILGGFCGWAMISALTMADTIPPRYRRLVRMAGAAFTWLVTGIIVGAALIGTTTIEGLQIWHLALIFALGGLGIALGLELSPAPFTGVHTLQQRR